MNRDTYTARAEQHRPPPQAMLAEIRRLHATGLTAQDIAVALRLDVAAVRSMLGQQVAR